MRRIIVSLSVLQCAALCHAQFSEAQPLFRSPGYHALSQCTADLNGDGHLDLLVGSGGGVHWSAGDGSGGHSALVALLSDPAEEFVVAAADADGDGDVDVACAAHTHGRAYLLWNTGDGTFAAPMELTGTGEAFVGLGFADLDGDGDADLVAGRTDGLHQFKNNGGTFLVDELLVSGSMTHETFAIGDLNADGSPDLAMAADTNYLFTYHLNDGTGAFPVEDTLIPGDNSTRAVCMADADADGDLDIFTTRNAQDYVVIFRNAGDGTFPDFGEYAYGETWEPAALHMGDVDGDGDADMLLGSTYSGVLQLGINDGTGLGWTVQTVGNYLEDMRSLGMADMNEDGTPDLVYTNYLTGQVGFILGQGGTYDERTPVSPPIGPVRRVYTADLNGDGYPDVAGCSEEPDGVVIGLSDGSGGIGEFYALEWSREYGTSELAFADVDGDGDTDLFRDGAFDSPCALYANDGSGHFTVLSLFGPLQPNTMTTGDVDGDGDMDMAFVASGAVSVGIYTNNGNGTGWTLTNLENASSLPFPNGIAIRDLDGDGDQDIAVHNAMQTGSGYMYLLENDGSWGAPYPCPTTFLGQYFIHNYIDFDFGDVDGDGDLDVLGAQDYYAHLTCSRNNGPGNIMSTQVLEDLPVYELRSAALMDVDGDGDLDAMALQRPFPTVPCFLKYYDNDGTGIFDTAVVLPANIFGGEWMEPLDMDGDGDQDVLIASTNGQGIYWMENFYGSPYSVQGRLFYDVDGDGASTPDEPGFPYAQLAFAPVGSTPLTTANGDYAIGCDAGTYAVSPAVDPALWQLTSPNSSYSVTVDDLQPVSTGNDFGYLPTTDSASAIVWSTSTQSLCNANSVHWAGFTNAGNTLLRGSFELVLDPLLTFVSAVPPPDQVAGNSYQWSVDSVFYYDHWTVQLVVTSPTVDHIGDTVHVMSILHAVDENGVPLADFTDDHATVVACAYDPNVKVVEPSGSGPQGLLSVTEAPLEYTVHFQNTGTAPAANVRISDPLSPLLDPTSLVVLGASHELTNIFIGQDREAVFRFDGIQLPDSNTNEPGSHGFIRFSIQPVQGLPSGSVVYNHAAIYFDLNPPVITDTTVNTFYDCAGYTPTITELSPAVLEAGAGTAYQWFQNGEPMAGSVSQQVVVTSTAWYSVQVTGQYGCTAMSEAYQVLFAGMDGPAAGARLVAWPVPASDAVRLLSSTPITSSDRIELIDVNGKVLGSQPGNGSNTLIIERKDLSAGLYTVRLVRADKEVVLTRLVWQ